MRWYLDEFESLISLLVEVVGTFTVLAASVGYVFGIVVIRNDEGIVRYGIMNKIRKKREKREQRYQNENPPITRRLIKFIVEGGFLLMKVPYGLYLFITIYFSIQKQASFYWPLMFTPFPPCPHFPPSPPPFPFLDVAIAAVSYCAK